MVQISDDFYEDLTRPEKKVLDALAPRQDAEARPADRPRRPRRPIGGPTHGNGGVRPMLRTRTASSPTSTASTTGGWPARARAATGTAPRPILDKGRDGDHRRDEEVRPARPRRRRIPDRHEVVLHAEGGERPAALPRGQRRRVRARHLQGPRHHAARPAQAGRGLPDRRLRHGGARRLHLRARRVLPRGREPAARRSTRPTRRA